MHLVGLAAPESDPHIVAGRHRGLVQLQPRRRAGRGLRQVAVPRHEGHVGHAGHVPLPGHVAQGPGGAAGVATCDGRQVEQHHQPRQSEPGSVNIFSSAADDPSLSHFRHYLHLLLRHYAKRASMPI